MITNVYIDGFNLYYGAVKDTPHRWLDLSALCGLLLPKHQINRIKYFTARVTALPRDPDQPARQQLYLRALATIPNLEIFYGHFLTHRVRLPLADMSGFAEVIKAEEKGSDVALATQLLHDAHRGDYEVAVVISNDSDLVSPISIVRYELGKSVGVVCPHPRISRELQNVATFIKKVRPAVLQASQFPETIKDSTGDFHKPPTW